MLKFAFELGVGLAIAEALEFEKTANRLRQQAHTNVRAQGVPQLNAAGVPTTEYQQAIQREYQRLQQPVQQQAQNIGRQRETAMPSTQQYTKDIRAAKAVPAATPTDVMQRNLNVEQAKAPVHARIQQLQAGHTGQVPLPSAAGAPGAAGATRAVEQTAAKAAPRAGFMGRAFGAMARHPMRTGLGALGLGVGAAALFGGRGAAPQPPSAFMGATPQMPYGY